MHVICFTDYQESISVKLSTHDPLSTAVASPVLCVHIDGV